MSNLTVFCIDITSSKMKSERLNAEARYTFKWTFKIKNVDLEKNRRFIISTKSGKIL